MPTFEHEALVELFQHRHLLAVELAEVHGLKLPDWQAAVPEPTEAPDMVSSRNAGAVIKLTDETGQAVFALVVEVQRGRDDDKQWSWPLYLAQVRHRLKCPVALLVICTDEATVTWAYKPIVFGPGSMVSPFPVGPNQVPVVSDPERARENPQLAVLSGLAHGGNPDRRETLDAVVVAFDTVGRERAALYHDLMAGGLPEAALKYLEERMALTGTYQYKSEFARTHFSRGEAEGEVRGEVKALLRVLARRGVELPDRDRDRITGCRDLEQLEAWLDRAVTATSIDDVLDE